MAVRSSLRVSGLQVRRVASLGPGALSAHRTGIGLVGVCVVVGVAAGVLTAATSPLVGFGLVVGVLAVVALALDVQVGLLFFVGIAYLLPFGVLPVPIGGVRLTFLDAILTVMLLLWLFRLLARPDVGFVSTPLDGLLLVFIGLALVSFLIGLPLMTAEQVRLFLKLINSLIFYFTVTNFVRRRPDLQRLGLGLLAAATGSAAVALGLYVLQPGVAAQLLSSLRVLGYPTGPGVIRYIAGTDTLRAIGTSVDPNVLGGMMVLAIPLAVALLVAERPPVGRKWLLPALLGLVVCLALTYSRGAWLGATAGVLFVGTIKDRRIWLAFVVLVAALYFLPVGQGFVDRFESGVTVQDQASAMRLGEYKDALRLISQYPWFGVGFIKAPSIDLYVAASSIYLMMAEQMGLIGLGAYLALLGVFFGHALRGRRRLAGSPLAPFQLGTLAGIAGALVAGLVDHYFFNVVFPHMLALFWLFVGLTVVATKLGAERPPVTAGSNRTA